jgi:hypothetical protein
MQRTDAPLTAKATADTFFYGARVTSQSATRLLYMFLSVFLILSIDVNQRQPFPDGSQMAPGGQQDQQQQPMPM